MSLKSAVMLVLLLSSLVTFAQSDQTVGSIQGVVLDESGNPVAGADVYAVAMENMLRQITATSDSAGKFIIKNVPVGEVYHEAFVHAYKISEGYADNFGSFYMNKARAPVKVSIKPGGTTIGVTVHVGPKVAYLKIDITDETGTPYQSDSSLIFERDDIPNKPYSRGLPMRGDPIMVPPVPFRFTVEVPGYETWHYGGADWTGKGGLITLKSGQTLTVVIRLRKKKD